MLVFLYPSKRITQTYILLGIRQALPFLCHLGSDILDSHVFEVSCAGSFVEVQKVSRSGALDQSVVIKKRNRSVLNSRKSAAGLVCLLDLQRGVRFNPCFVGGLVGNSVGFRLRSKLLSSSVSRHKRDKPQRDWSTNLFLFFANRLGHIRSSLERIFTTLVRLEGITQFACEGQSPCSVCQPLGRSKRCLLQLLDLLSQLLGILGHLLLLGQLLLLLWFGRCLRSSLLGGLLLWGALGSLGRLALGRSRLGRLGFLRSSLGTGSCRIGIDQFARGSRVDALRDRVRETAIGSWEDDAPGISVDHAGGEAKVSKSTSTTLGQVRSHCQNGDITTIKARQSWTSLMGMGSTEHKETTMVGFCYIPL